MTKQYLYAVQDEDGRELLARVIEPAKVSDVVAVWEGTTHIALYDDGLDIDRAEASFDKTYTLHRWPAEDKLAAPVSHAVLPGEQNE